MNQETIKRIQEEIGKVIIGKDDVIAKVLMSILAGGHVLLEDVPGVGKTTLTLAFAKVLGLETKRVQFTSDSVPSDIIGFSLYNKERGAFEYKAGAIMTNLLLADEINRTSSKTQSALLEAMEEFHVTVDGQTHPLPEPFIVLATQNPVGSAGTQLLPNSQLDRFLIRTSMGYPDAESEISILRDRSVENPLKQIETIVTKEALLGLIGEVKEIHVDDLVYTYVSQLVDETRRHEMVQLGISTRGALALCRMAKAYAFLHGRDYVVPEDVIAVLNDVCGHRLVLNSKARLTETTEKDILKGIAASVQMPVMREE